MPCDTRLKPSQTIKQRAVEVRAVVERTAAALAAGRVKAVIDRKTGAIAFAGISDADRDGVTDACMYRRMMATGSAQAKMALAKAEMLAGRSVSLQALAHGVHAHASPDGTLIWHGHKG